MALHVTQCPSCESTFNTSAQVLAMARGRVRCGACLSVFEANENIVNTLASASNDELGPGETNSVFISPENDYFDPASFFIRSDLQTRIEISAVNETFADDESTEDNIPTTDEFQRTEAMSVEIGSPDSAEITDEELSSDNDINFGKEISSDQAINFDGELSSDQDIHFGTEISSDQEINFVGKVSSTQDIHFDGEISSDQDIHFGAEMSSDQAINFDGESSSDKDINFGSELSLDHEVDSGKEAPPVPLEAGEFDAEEFESSQPWTITDRIPETEQDEVNPQAKDLEAPKTAFGWIIKSTSVESPPVRSPAKGSTGINLIPPAEATATDATSDAESEFFHLHEGPEVEPAERADPESVVTVQIEAEEANSELSDDIAPALSSPRPEPKDAIIARLMSSRLHDDLDEATSLSRENLAAISAVDSSLELAITKPARKLKRLVVFSVASFLLGLLLVGQFYWQRMSILSLDPELRPWYEAACSVLGCELAPLQNLASIQTENLAIRSHPEIPGSLVVTAVFRNLASFQQPFPIIELSFSNLDNQLVASRAFLPSEYLAPQLRSIKNMPVGSPVQITIELVDPGEDAVNYSLSFEPFPIQP